MNESGKRNGDPPQLQIWDTATREFEVGTLHDHDDTWSIVVVAERSASDLCRGRISFRRGEERYDTDAILLENTEQELVRRASELPASTLRQFLAALTSD
ncbi:MAG: hypothetical protein Q8W45_04180 [Candidatus Palauibacterales bacterium]|jgi:hypothetical protein|nr:hypothetical protein [Candidatus Palauibacterales bacterium]MDP2482461.1 hypothetical protein [Candidatus Palauibacterales bacterium]